MNENSTLNRNLLALGTRCSHPFSEFPHGSKNHNLEFITSRSGHPVPILSRNGRPYPMHSRFDPENEGKRIAAEAPRGFLIAFGMGGGYHLVPLLQNNNTTGLIIVEKDAALIRQILETIDLTQLFLDSRVILLVDSTPDELAKIVLDRYLPVLYGNLGSISLRTRWDAEPQWFADMAKSVRGLSETLGRDYSVQSRFGRRWFVHTITNIRRSEEVFCMLPPAGKLCITAAGPSLQTQLPRIRQLKKNGTALLATDTSLPVLISAGIAPDIVLSIDCQIISSQHFFKRLPEETILLLDLASPPILTRLTDRILFYSSGHPFSLYINQFYRAFPILDISGGNVTHAAVSFADIAGTEEVILLGGDFSYPDGRPYAQGTYIYPHFQSISTRTAGSESYFWKFIAAGQPEREKTGAGWRWRTKTMDHYREELESVINTMNCQFLSEPGNGVPIHQKKAVLPRHSHIASIPTVGPVQSGWKDFLTRYQNHLERLPPMRGSRQDYLEGLKPEIRQAWTTLLPAAAAFQNSSKDGTAALESARQWTLNRVSRVLSRTNHSHTTPA